MKKSQNYLYEQTLESITRGRIWDAFEAKLANAHTIDEAWAIVDTAPNPDHPARKHYSNLKYFLSNSFATPLGANENEVQAYLELVRRLDTNGVLKPGALSVLESRLK